MVKPVARSTSGLKSGLAYASSTRRLSPLSATWPATPRSIGMRTSTRRPPSSCATLSTSSRRARIDQEDRRALGIEQLAEAQRERGEHLFEHALECIVLAELGDAQEFLGALRRLLEQSR